MLPLFVGLSICLDPIFQAKGSNNRVPVSAWVLTVPGLPAQTAPAAWGGLGGLGLWAGCGQFPSQPSRCFSSLPINHSPSWSLSGSLSEVSKISCSRRLTMQRAVTAPAGRPGGDWVSVCSAGHRPGKAKLGAAGKGHWVCSAPLSSCWQKYYNKVPVKHGRQRGAFQLLEG